MSAVDPAKPLAERGVVRIAGEDAMKLLDGLFTCDLKHLARGEARHGALLSPQGKILFDFLISGAADETGGGFWCDVPRAASSAFAKRLALYKLRARVEIADRSNDHVVMWSGTPLEGPAAHADPRLAALGFRSIAPSDASEGVSMPTADHCHRALRLRLGVPDVADDFGYGEVFPHEALMDQLAGVDFSKGCYVGQEVVSRMQHRGSVRSRAMQLRFEGGDLDQGSELSAGGRPLGTVGRSADGFAIALVRLDRASEALAAGVPILAGGRPVSVVKASFARFPFPLVDAGPVAV